MNEILSRLPRLLRPLVVAGIVGIIAYYIAPRPPRKRRRRNSADVWIGNPASRGEIEDAIRFRRDFHWGIPTKRVSRRRIAKAPRVATKLGTLEGVIYRTNKRGDGMTSYVHEFSGNKPDLLMDIDNQRLHIAGGSYDVQGRGIVG